MQKLLNKLKNRLIVFCAILLINGWNLQAQNPYVQHYTTIDGLPSNMVYHILQDSRKFIWFATDAGVAKFDGSKFIWYRKTNGLNSNEVIKIKEDSFGRIWFFNLDASFNFFYRNTIYNSKNAPFLDSLKSKEFFNDFFEDEDKTIYFYYNFVRDIFSLDSLNNVKKYKLPSILFSDETSPIPLEGMILRYMNRSPTGEFNLWTRLGIFKVNSLSEKPIFVPNSIGLFAVFPVSKTSGYVMGVPANTKNYEIRKFRDEIMGDSIPLPFSPTSKFISKIMEDNNGFLWISTFDYGVFCLKNNQLIRHFDISQAQAIIQDHENNIWVSSMKDGVFKISPHFYPNSHYEATLFGNSGISALGSHLSDGIWFSNGKTVYLLKDSQIYASDFQKVKSSFNQILHFKNNTLLVGEKGTYQFALEGIRTNPQTKKIYFDNVFTSRSPFKKFALNKTGTEVSSFNHFTLRFINPGKFTEEFKWVNVRERIFITFYNSSNELIINAKNNYIYRNDSLIICDELSRFNNKIITDHLIINNSFELFNIEGDSLFLLNNKQWYNLTSAFAYPIDLQIKYIEYSHPTLFIATSRNIYLIENPLNIIKHELVQLVPVDISFRNITDILFNDSLLYVASDDGLTVIPYHSIREISSHAPIPYFQSIQINDEKDEVNRSGIAITGRNRIQIVFSSINYSFSPVIFSYKLEGADNEWTTGTGTNVVYQDLPRGHYIFKLKVRKPTSGWSEPIEYAVTIKATFWQHPLFYVILSLFITGMVFLLILWRKNRDIKRREVEHQLVLLEQKALQSMMNPHFIFNTLASVQNYLLQSKPHEAGLYLSRFARLIRQNIYAINSSMIKLEEEVDRLKNYLDLERLRMGNKFDYQIDFEEGIEEFELMLPSMIIQPFVENSIWHGIAALEDHGLIRIIFAMHSEQTLKITIEDNGIGIMQARVSGFNKENHLNIGMATTMKRLEIIGKRKNVEASVNTFELSPGSPNPGTRVVLLVPVSFGNESQI